MSMHSLIRSFRSPRAAIRADADQLIAKWGDAAFDVATQIASREDMGWLKSPAVGHWSRVRGEVGQRLGRQEMGPRADFAPGRSPSLMERDRLEA